MLVLHPVIELLVDSKPRFCGVFLHMATQQRSREKGTKYGFARSVPQKAMGIWKRGAGVTATHYGNLVSQVERFQSSDTESATMRALPASALQVYLDHFF